MQGWRKCVVAAFKTQVNSWEEGDCGFGNERIKSGDLWKK